MKKKSLIEIYNELNAGGYIKKDGASHYMVYDKQGRESIPLDAEEFNYLLINGLIK